MKTLIISFALLFSIDGFSQLINAESLRKQKYYDSILNGMRLRDVASVEKVIGTSENMIEPQNEQTEVLNGDGHQLLTMVFHPGDVVNQFSQFRIEYNSKGIKSKYKINSSEFITGKGIKLGIGEQYLVTALGPPNEKKIENDYLKYVYKQDNGLYFGFYWFRNGKLEKFWFGEEYP